MAWTCRVCGAAVVVAMALAAGCGDRPSENAASNPPAPAAARPADGAESSAASAQAASARQSATSPAETQPAVAFISIDGAPTQFPAARLRLTKTSDGVRALLFSDDPKKAVAAEYRGNSFYFDVPLSIVDPKDLADAEYWYRAKTSDAEDDSPNGIFLNGMATHLQPQDVVITFDGEAPRAVAKVAGRFLVVRTTGASTPGQFATVTGTLFATVEVKGE
jgi:hypothetical protein